MGLDTVAIVLETERRFAIELPDEECSEVLTVGDLYRLVLRRLDLAYLPAKSAAPVGFVRRGGLLSPTWNAADVWCTLKDIIVEQLQLDPDEIHEGARFLADLGCE